MTSALYRNVLYPVWHWVKRDGANAAVKELAANQWLPLEELLQLQSRKLANLLNFASKNVPYYNRISRELGVDTDKLALPENFRQLPRLTKDIIRGEQEALVSENLTGNTLRANSTSGSTGAAIRFFTDARSIPYRKAAARRSDSFTGWRPGDRIVRLWGAAIDKKRSAKLRGRLHGWVTGDCFLSSFDLSPASMDEYIKTIRVFKPVLFVAYPGPLEQFALHCRDRDVKFSSLKAIVSSAETLWPPQREIIEDAFGVKIFNRYGTREVGQIASECPTHEGLHLSVDRLFLEIVDDDGQPCQPGQVGRMLVTDLDNYGMPLIRYDIGDRGAMTEQASCSCGRGLPRLEKVEGRTLDIVFTPDGRRIGGTFWTLLLRSRRGLKQFQVVQNDLDGVVIHFVRDTVFDDDAMSYFVRKIRENCGSNFKVEFAEKESIELTASGKQRLIVSRLAKQAGSTATELA